MQNYPKVSIIFPNYNGGQEPIDCLKSIAKLNYPQKKIETIVIDNGSTDGSDIKIKKLFPKVKFIKNQENVGFAKAVNRGILASTATYIFIGNDDLVFIKDSLKNLIDYAAKISTTGVLGGKIFYKNNPRKLASCGYYFNKWTGRIQTKKKPNSIGYPDWVQGCAMLIPRKVFQKIGLLDERFTHLFEDFDFCQRAKKSGYRVIYLPTAHFLHRESVTANKNKSLKYFHWYKGKMLFLIKNMPIPNIMSILLLQLLIITPYRALFLHDGRLFPFLKALTWNLKHLSENLKLRNKNYQPKIA